MAISPFAGAFLLALRWRELLARAYNKRELLALIVKQKWFTKN